MATFGTGSFDRSAQYNKENIVGTADKDYFLDAEGNVTTDEEKAATLLIREGQDMSVEVAEKIGKVAQPEDAEAKATSPSLNKSDAPTKNKGVK